MSAPKLAGVREPGLRRAGAQTGGGAGGASTALLTTIADAGNYYTSGNVEGALQESFAAIGLRPKSADLASTVTGKGASTIGVENAINWLGMGGTDLEGFLASSMAVVSALNDAIQLYPTNNHSEGASLIGIEDAGALITATTVEGALAELATGRTKVADLASAAGGLGAALVGFNNGPGYYPPISAGTVQDVLANISTTRAKLTDLALTTTGNGASLIGIEDAAGKITATTVEAALAELALASPGVTTVPLTKGGTGQITAAAAFDALSIRAADLTSAATVDLSLAGCAGTYAVVNGSTGPITSFGTAPTGTARVLRFAGTPTITHNAVSLILPGAANIVAAAGDVMFLHSISAGNWRCTSYLRAAAPPWNADASALTQGTLALAQGGSGQTTANAALTAFQTMTAAQVSLLSLADATTTTAPEIWTLKHRTSGTPAAGFGVLAPVDLDSSTNVLRRAMTDVTKWTTATNAAEVASRTISLMAAGALSDMIVLGKATDYSNVNFPNPGSVTAPAVTFGVASEKTGFHAGGNVLYFDCAGVTAMYIAWNGISINQAILTNYSGSAASPVYCVSSQTGVYNSGNGVGISAAATGVATFLKTAAPFVFTAPTPATANNTASTEFVAFDVNMARTTNWATGALATQREVLFRAPTYTAVAASTITSAATVAIDKAPVAGTNVTITNPYAWWVQAGATRLDGNIGFSKAPVAIQNTTGTTTGFTAGGGTTATDASTFTGGTGATAYRISDIVLALKNYGLLAA